MKRLLVALVICVGIAASNNTAFAERCGQCCVWNSLGEQQNGQNRFTATTEEEKKTTENGAVETRWAGRSCSLKDLELQQLLRELKSPIDAEKKILGGESEVRRKYRIARKLRNFDCCCAKEALEQLIKENSCEALDEGTIFCVTGVASSSLQEIKSKKDLEKLTADTSLEDQLKIIKKYGQRPHENEFASHAVRNFLAEQYHQKPNVYVPLLVEYFPHFHKMPQIAKKYPKEVVTGLKRSIFSPDPIVVWTGIHLARTFNKVQLMESIYGVAFEETGPLDYSQQEEIEEIQKAAIGYLRTFEKDAVPYYREVLYSGYELEQQYVVSGIRDLKNPEILAMLEEFSKYLKNNPDKTSSLLADRVQKKIVEMMVAQ